MPEQSVPVVDLREFAAGGARRDACVQAVGDALVHYGFMAVEHHGIDPALFERAYAAATAFFALPEHRKLDYRSPRASGQRGFTPFGQEHAKDSDSPDLKEFYQVGRVDVPDEHPVHAPFGPNVWPDAEVAAFRPVMSELYRQLDAVGATLLRACALYLAEREDLFSSMVTDSDTILRVIHYPPVPDDAPAGSVRAAAHEDINLITLLPGATAEGLELQRRDGSWMPVAASHEHIVADSGDMLQNLTNGLFRSTTHRVVNPADASLASVARFSMPCFIHPRKDIDLTPLPGSVARTGGERRFEPISAGDYLVKRLREIGLL